MLTLKTNLESIKINFAAAEQTVEVKLGDLPIETIDYLLQGATRKFNDAVNSEAKELRAKGESVNYAQLIDKQIERIKSGNFTATRSNDPEVAFKKFVIETLKTLKKVTNKDIENLKGLTVENIIKAVYKDKTSTEVKKAVETLRQRYAIATEEFML